MKAASPSKRSGKKGSTLIILLVLLFLGLGIPLLILNYQSRKSGTTLGEVIQRKKIHMDESDQASIPGQADMVLGEKLDFLEPQQIGMDYSDTPMISNLAVVDLDEDGLLDVVVCDAKNNFISLIRQFPSGTFTEKILANEVIAPAHVEAIDFDSDGDKDLLVAILGLLYPSNDKIGSVMILENDGMFNFQKHIVIEKIARVSDVRSGDLDGDGDQDLAVAQFGYDDGETRWIENLGNWEFESHILQNLSGPINVDVVDIDNDQDLDIISLVSQEWEEIYCYINDGIGRFQMKLLWGSDNQDFGSSGIYIYDLNQDGQLDILYTNGDAFDYIPPKGQPWHGLQWFENKGNLNFEYRRLCTLVGAYSLRPADVDLDGDPDLFAVSAFNLWEDPESQSFIWLENLGNMQFKKRNLTSNPTHLIILETGDFNNDGLTDFVTGGMYPYPPFDRMSRITLWTNKGIVLNIQ